MNNPNQANFFFKKINGKEHTFKHQPRHKANDRQVAIIKFLEAMGLKEETCPEIRLTFRAGYNMGYKEAKKRTWKNEMSNNKTKLGGEK